MKRTVKFWIENNPHTGAIKPFEVWFQVQEPGFCKNRVSSCETMTGAEKSMAKAIKRNSTIYNIE